MNTIHEQKTIYILKNIIKTIIIDYNLNTQIHNSQILHQHLFDIIFKTTTNINFYTPNRVDILLNFLERKITRGAIIPRSIQDLLLELIEILHSLLQVKNTINHLTEQLFTNQQN